MKTPREWQRLWLQMGFDDLLFIDLLAQVQREAFDAGARAMHASQSMWFDSMVYNEPTAKELEELEGRP